MRKGRGKDLIFYGVLFYLITIGTGVLYPSYFQAFFVDSITSYRGILSEYRYLFPVSMTKNPSYFSSAKHAHSGVIVNSPSSYSGYTFFVQNVEDAGAVLIDEDGKVVHQWHVPKHKLLDIFPNIKSKGELSFVQVSRAFLSPTTGDAYLMYQIVQHRSELLGLIKVDKYSNIVWSLNESVHHDLAISEKDDKIYVLYSETKYEPIAELRHLVPPYADEGILVLDGQGRELKRISFIEIFKKHKMNGIFLNSKHTTPGDYLHSNAVEIVPDTVDAKQSPFKPGDIVVSMRGSSSLMAINPETTELSWITYGPWRLQHDPVVYPDGTIAVLDNAGGFNSEHGFSRVVKFDPLTMTVLWVYDGSKDKPFYTAHSGTLDILPNNNILVTESTGQRIFEVTPEKEVVWEYINTQHVSAPMSNEVLVPAVFSAKRYAQEDIVFLTGE